MEPIDSIILGLAIIRTKLSDPLIVLRSVLLHVPEALLSLFNPAEQAALDSYGWEIHSAEGGYMFRLNKEVP